MTRTIEEAEEYIATLEAMLKDGRVDPEQVRFRCVTAEQAVAVMVLHGDFSHCQGCLKPYHKRADCSNSGSCEGCGDCVHQTHELWPVAAVLRRYYLAAGMQLPPVGIKEVPDGH
jgi:hypothetical protein